MGKKEIVKRELGFKLRTCGGTRKRGIGSGDRECCDENLLLSRVETLGEQEREERVCRRT
jgi:hypothetical protein